MDNDERKVVDGDGRRTMNWFYAVVVICVVAIAVAVFVAQRTADTDNRGDDNNLADGGMKSVSESLLLAEDQRKPEEILMPGTLGDGKGNEIGQTQGKGSESQSGTVPDEDELRSAGNDTTSEDEAKAVAGAAAAPKYTRPVKGPIITAHSGDELVYSVTLDDWRVHTGVDYRAALGEAVRVIADGTVTKVFSDDLKGSAVEVTHDNGVVSCYYNLQSPSIVKEGQKVSGGDTIGGVGETAISEIAIEPHLHFEAKKNGKQIDPENLFN